MRKNRKFMCGALTILALCAHSSLTQAEDCVGTLPGTDCSLDENTTAPLTIGAGETLTIDGNISLNHTIDGNLSDGDGTIQTIGGGVSIQQNAAIGSTTPINNIIINDGDSWTASANIITNNGGNDIDLGATNGGEVLNLNTGLTITGEIDGHATDIVNVGSDGLGGTFNVNGEMQTVTLNVTSGELNANAAFGNNTVLNAINIADGATFNVNSNVTSGGALDLDGDVAISSTSTLLTDTYTADADSGNIDFGLSSSSGSTVIGRFNVTNGGPVDLSNDTATFTIETGSQVIEAQTITNVILGNGGATNAPTVNDTSFLYNYSFQTTGDNLDLVIDRQDLATATTSKNNETSARLLFETLSTSENADVQAVQNRLSSASTEADFNSILESTQPTVDGSAGIAARITSRNTANIIRERLQNIRYERSNPAPLTRQAKPQAEPLPRWEQRAALSHEDKLAERRQRYLEARNRNLAKSRKTSGQDPYDYSQKTSYDPEREAEKGPAIWAQTFVHEGTQDAYDNINGYDVSGMGLSVGMDTADLHDNAIFGLSFTFADHTADSDNANQTETDTSTYQASFYGSYEFDSGYYLDGIIAYSMNDIESSRRNVGGGTGTANSEYDSDHYRLDAEIGKLIELDNNILIQPSFFAMYRHTEFEDYTEEGAGDIGLIVDPESQDAMLFGPSIKIATIRALGDGKSLIPSLGLRYGYDVIQDQGSYGAIFIGEEEEAIKLEGSEAPAHHVDLNLGIKLLARQWNLNANYEYNYQEDLSGHSGSLQASYKF